MAPRPFQLAFFGLPGGDASESCKYLTSQAEQSYVFKGVHWCRMRIKFQHRRGRTSAWEGFLHGPAAQEQLNLCA